LDLGISGRVALVMGAGSGLGAAICAALAAEGFRVAGGGRRREALDPTRAALRERGSDLLLTPVDLRDLDALDTVVERVESELGPVDILVNNTGGPPPTTASGVPADQWRRHFDAMVTPAFHLTDAVLPGMRRRGWGRILTSTSSGVIAPIPNLALSNTLRAALVAWSKTLASEIGRGGVTSNIVLPGRIDTERVASLDRNRAEREGRSVEEVRADSVVTIPVGRYGRPDEYGAAVAFLAGDHASFITGSVTRIDGGLIPSV
jgi:3-oxoacyl-[acyl-carrier protein] reductase